MTVIKTRGLLETFEPKADFWKVNPQMQIIEPFKTLFKSDRSESKHKSSKMMWFIALCYDQSSSNHIRNLPLSDKHEMLSDELFKDKKYYSQNKADFLPYITAYIDLCDTPAMRALRVWNDKMLERAKLLESVPYTMENLDPLDKAIGSTKKLYDDYARILKEINSEDGEVEGNRGGGESSLTDKGLI